MKRSRFIEPTWTAESFLQRPFFLLVITKVIVRSLSHVLTLHERQMPRAIHFKDFYNHRDERTTISRNYANRIPSDAASCSRKIDSSSIISGPKTYLAQTHNHIRENNWTSNFVNCTGSLAANRSYPWTTNYSSTKLF
jgi:hypothetical protein